MERNVAVVGAGWAGLAVAVRLCEGGHRVTVYEMAAQPGGRARTLTVDGLALDNGQHILIGAYTRTLALMRTVGADPQTLLHRMPLTLRYPDGRGLQSPGGAAISGFVRAVSSCVGWTWSDRVALMMATGGWAARGFRCDPALTVEQLCAELPPAVRDLLIDPLCVAALNTPAHSASAAVLLRVLKDALFGGRGASDLLLPRRPLSELLPAPAAQWLAERGARLHVGHRVRQLVAGAGAGWHVDTTPHDAVVLACSATEAARLVAPFERAWAARAAALHSEPIVTVYLRCPGAALAQPMMALLPGAQAPAQFAFDHGALGGEAGRFAFAVSGARAWVDRGLKATGAAVLAQAGLLLPSATLLRTVAEKRATFSCTPGLDRPPAQIAPGLVAAGDFVQGPYPATLEGAVRSGEHAAAMLSGL